MKKILVSLFIIIISIAFSVYVIDGNETSLTSNTLENSIVYSVLELPSNMQSIHDLSTSDIDVICATSKGLVSKNENNEIVPELASDYSVSSDKLEYKFKIRDDIYWSDGSKITIDEISDFFRELIKEENEDTISALLNVYGAKDYRDEKIRYYSGVAIEMSDDSITFRLNSASDTFAEELTKPQYRVRKTLFLWRNIKNNYKDLKYSGDYKINSVDNNSIVLNKSNENCKFDSINFKKEETSETAMASYEINLTDIVISPPSSVLNKLSEADKLITIPENTGTYAFINDNNGIPLQGRRDLYKLLYESIENYHNQNINDFDLAETCYFREDQDNLVQMQERKVDSNKTNDWSRPSVITIIGIDNKMNRILCKSIKDYFDNNTETTIKYRLVNKDEFTDKELKNKYDIILVSNEANAYDKEQFYSNFEEYLTKLNLNILESTRINDYYGDYKELENSLFSNYNILPLCFENKNIAYSNKISSLSVDCYGNVNFDNLN